MTKKLKLLKAICPMCGNEYEHLANYKPKTCGQFACIYKHLHQSQQKGGDRSKQAKLANS